MDITAICSIIYFQKCISILFFRLHERYDTNYSDYVAQWVYPHLTGLAYLRYHKTVFPVSRVCLQ